MIKKCFLVVLLVFSAGAGVLARTLEVGKGKAFTRVREAIAAAQNGDTVRVFPGLYREGNIVVNKSLVLLGVDFPVMDGEYKSEIFSIKSSHVVLKGFKVIRSGVSSIEDMGGIKVYDSEYVIVANNILEDCFFGVYIQYSKNCRVINNTIFSKNKRLEHETGNGVHCWKSDSLLIQDNSIIGHRDGMYLEFASNTTVLNNIAKDNMRYGLHFMFSHGNFYILNTFINNGAGVAVMYSREVKMYNNYFAQNWGDAAYGLLLKELTDSYVEGNTFVQNTTGIFMDGSSRVTVKRNVFRSNGWALKMQANCMDIEVMRNNFMSNTFDVGTNGSLVLNNITGNYWDKYEGYDLNRDKRGDVPYRPVSLFSMIVEQNPPAMIMLRSFMSTLLDKTEKVLPSITPENLVDNEPYMKPLPL